MWAWAKEVGLEADRNKVAESARKIKYLQTPKGQEYQRLKSLRQRPKLLAWAATLSQEERLHFRRERIQRKRAQAFEILGDKCVKCGFDDPRALQVDHVIPVGQAHEDRLYKEKFWQKIIDNPNDYQRLCANCNIIKAHEEGMFLGKTAEVINAARVSTG